MTDQEILVQKVSAFIQKNLRGNTPFGSTSDFISYIANKEAKKKTEKEFNFQESFDDNQL